MEKNKSKKLDLSEIYTKIKNESKEAESKAQEIKSILQNSFMYNGEDILQSKHSISFIGKKTKWLYSTFSTTIQKNDIEFPNLKKTSWNLSNSFCQTGIEIRNLIFQTEESINYEIVNNEINTKVLLGGESTFWIFLHINSENIFNTVIILFNKEEKSQKCCVSLGTFVKNGKETEFVVFFTQQLIKEEIYKCPKNNDKFIISDTCFLKIKIFDSGSNEIKVVTNFNEGKYENELIGDFLIPVNLGINSSIENCKPKVYKIMIAGSGEQCKILNFNSENTYKKNFEFIEYNKGKNNGCACCLIS